MNGVTREKGSHGAEECMMRDRRAMALSYIQLEPPYTTTHWFTNAPRPSRYSPCSLYMVLTRAEVHDGRSGHCESDTEHRRGDETTD